MITCTVCLRRALHNLALDIPANNTPIQFRGLTTNLSSSRRDDGRQYRKFQRLADRRSHATLASIKKGHHRTLLRKGVTKSNALLGNKRRKAPWALTKVERKDALARDKNKSWLRRDEAQEDEQDEEGDAVRSTGGEMIRPSELDESKEKTLKTLKQKIDAQKKQDRRLAKKDENDIDLYYKDPLQLANGVLQRLRVPDIEGALRLVRASETFEIKNIVSWNHCMDWLMSQGDVKYALQAYNEMKKRGHRPDSHTYTIMLRGLSTHVNKPNAVQEAVKIYNSIYAPNSAVTPNTIHTNAIINVCARGGDMDSLWAVAGRLPEKGQGSPDRVTFTTILNAIRENTIRETARTIDKVKFGGDADAAAAARTKMFEQAVADGRKLWEDISHKWRRADLVIDETLVCAMGRLILGCGIGKDIEQVLDLVETTMRLRIPERRSKAKSSAFARLAPPNNDEQDFVGADEVNETSMLPLRESNVYVTPNNNTLSMLLEACFLHKPIRHLAPSYWHLLTMPEGMFNVEPDPGNIVAYLRILRINRASNRVYDLLSRGWSDTVSKKLFRRGTFVLAFATCARDKNNPNVFGTAQKLLKLMQDKLEENEVGMFNEGQALSEMDYPKRKRAIQKLKEERKNLNQEEIGDLERQKEGVQSLAADPKILQYFVELAVDTTKGWNEGIRGKDDGEVFERHITRNHTLIALRTVAPMTGQLKTLLKLKLDELQYEGVRNAPRRGGPASLNPRSGSRVGESVEELLDLMRVMIGAYDRVIDMADRLIRARKEGIDANLVADFNSKKREYTAFIARIEKTLAQKRKNASAFANEKDADNRARARDEEDEDDEDAEPDIERRIKAVLAGVDAGIVRERADQKGYKNNFFPREEPVLKVASRKQANERTKLRDNAIQKSFPKHDYGVLNEDLDVITSPAWKGRIEAQDRRRALGINELKRDGQKVRSSVTGAVKAKKRRPMIGDELGLDDEDDDRIPISKVKSDDDNMPAREATQKAYREAAEEAALDKPTDFKPQWMKARDQYVDKDGADWLLAQQNAPMKGRVTRGILGREDVRKAWDRPAARAAAASG